MKIRLMATENETTELIERLRQVVTVVDVSRPYANRRGSGESDLVRVYIEVRL